MNELYELKDKLIDELKEYGRKEMNGSNLEVIDKLAHATKNLCKIIDDGEYSGRYDDGMNRGSFRKAYRGYSRSDLTDKLRGLMDEAPDDRTRIEIKRLIEKM